MSINLSNVINLLNIPLNGLTSNELWIQYFTYFQVLMNHLMEKFNLFAASCKTDAFVRPCYTGILKE